MLLVSRTSNSFLGPFLAKRVERTLNGSLEGSLLSGFRWLLLSATLATIVGAVLTPTFQRVFTRAVTHFHTHRSISRLALHMLSRDAFGYFREDVELPSRATVALMRSRPGVSIRMLVINVLAVGLWSVGVFAALYAGSLEPSLRATCSNLSGLINGAATIMMYVFIDPQVSMMTDDVMDEKITHRQFRHAIGWLLGARLLGTVLAQVVFVPSAVAIASVARSL